MRVRFQFVGHAAHAECDLTEKRARRRFEELKEAGLCEWAELVGEDEDNYMEILDSFDRIKLARMIASIVG